MHVSMMCELILSHKWLASTRRTTCLESSMLDDDSWVDDCVAEEAARGAGGKIGS